MIYVGIDPGLRSGAVGAVDHNGEYVGCFDIPQTENGKRIDVVGMRHLLMVLLGGNDASVCMELVNPMPGQGSVSTGGFMRAAGMIEAVVELGSWPVMYVVPQVWKKAMGLTQVKDDSLLMARNLFHLAHRELKRKRDQNKAEALLLAVYLLRMEHGSI